VLSGVDKYRDVTLTGWTTVVLEDDVFEFELTAVDSTFTQVSIALTY